MKKFERATSTPHPDKKNGRPPASTTMRMWHAAGRVVLGRRLPLDGSRHSDRGPRRVPGRQASAQVPPLLGCCFPIQHLYFLAREVLHSELIEGAADSGPLDVVKDSISSPEIHQATSTDRTTNFRSERISIPMHADSVAIQRCHAGKHWWQSRHTPSSTRTAATAGRSFGA